MAQTDAAATARHLTDPDVMQCPFGLYRELHADGAAVHDEPGIGYLVHRYADVTALAKDTRRFSSTFGLTGDMLGVDPSPYSPEVQALVDRFRPMAPNALLMSDPPAHTRHRALVTKALNARRIREMEPKIRELCEQLVDAFVDDGRCDIVSQFAVRLPVIMITDALGVDRADMDRFKVWSDHLISGIIGRLDNEQRLVVARSILEFQDYMEPRIAERRREPTDDLLSDIVNVELGLDEDGAAAGPRKLTDPEVYAFIGQLLAGGNHTTGDMIGSATVLMAQHPEQMAELRADPSLIPSFLEEVLRMDGPVQCTWRRTTTDVEVAGVDIPAQSMLSPMWGAANKDPSVFPDPDRFDMHRPNAKKHLTFAHGPHFCAGAGLARAEGRIAFETLLSRLDDIRLVDPGGLRRRADFSTNGWERAEIAFTKIR